MKDFEINDKVKEGQKFKTTSGEVFVIEKIAGFKKLQIKNLNKNDIYSLESFFIAEKGNYKAKQQIIWI